MADLICPSCGETTHPAGASLCGQCWDPLVSRTITTVTPVVVMCAAPNCDFTAAECPFHSSTGASPVSVSSPQIKLPWGVISLQQETAVKFGRDHTNRWGTALAAYDNVSRNHAEFTVQGSTVFVTDCRSTNGTTVNGTAITPGIPAPVQSGDVIGFGKDLKATVQLNGDVK